VRQYRIDSNPEGIGIKRIKSSHNKINFAVLELKALLARRARQITKAARSLFRKTSEWNRKSDK
jgi:hypothetical protein